MSRLSARRGETISSRLKITIEPRQLPRFLFSTLHFERMGFYHINSVNTITVRFLQFINKKVYLHRKDVYYEKPFDYIYRQRFAFLFVGIQSDREVPQTTSGKN